MNFNGDVLNNINYCESVQEGHDDYLVATDLEQIKGQKNSSHYTVELNKDRVLENPEASGFSYWMRNQKTQKAGQLFHLRTKYPLSEVHFS